MMKAHACTLSLRTRALAVLPTRRTARLILLVSSILILALLPAWMLPAAPALAQDASPDSSREGSRDSLGAYRVTLDPEASTVGWTLGATLHTVEGTFRLESGEVTYDPRTGDVSGRVAVDATSGESGKEGRDDDMHRKVLESETHPRFVFTPSRVEGTFDPATGSRVTVHGTLEIHGGSHEITVPLTAAVNDGSFEATGSFTVPYVEWGMEDPSKFLLRVDKEVEVTVRAEGTLERLEATEPPSEQETGEGDDGQEAGDESGGDEGGGGESGGDATEGAPGAVQAP